MLTGFGKQPKRSRVPLATSKIVECCRVVNAVFINKPRTGTMHKFFKTLTFCFDVMFS